MHTFLNDCKNFLLDTLFPSYCLGCNKEGSFLCKNCLLNLEPADQQKCIVCRMASSDGLTHEHCKSNPLPNQLITGFEYTDPVLANAIIWGKYKFVPDIYTLLGEHLAKYVLENGLSNCFKNSVLCPIPLAKSRLRWRGFNQSMVLAKALSKDLEVPITELLIRSRATETQKDLNKQQRRNNVSGAFKIKDHEELKNKTIILIDDVITTGATLLEATKILKQNYNCNVICLSLARD